jgi:hypothetical protein
MLFWSESFSLILGLLPGCICWHGASVALWITFDYCIVIAPSKALNCLACC